MTPSSLPLTVNPAQVNPADSSLNLQVAMKNLSTNAVFYFGIPYTIDILFVPAPIPDVQSYVQLWKGFDESLEVSVLVNGTFNDEF